MRPRHVVLDALLVRPRPTGVGRSILELTRALAAEDSGLHFTVLATHPELFDQLADCPGWKIRHVARGSGTAVSKAFATQLELPRILRRIDASLLHALQFVAPVKAPCPVVVTVHDFGYLRHPEAIEPARRLYYRALVPATLRHARRVVTNSQATADETAAFFPELVGRIATTRFGTPSWVWRQPGAGTAIDAAQLQSCEAPFLFVGTLEPRKNLVGLLDGYELFRGRRELRTPGAPVPPLQIVGARGWRNRRIRRKLASLRDRGWVSVTDYCEPDALWRRYRSARALLFPSLYEGFGFPILEAMAAGLPVLTSNRGAMAEVAGDAALLVDPVEPEAIAAALECFHADGRLLAELAARGCTRARSWDWRTTARATLAVYDEILKEGRAETEPSRRI